MPAGALQEPVLDRGVVHGAPGLDFVRIPPAGPLENGDGRPSREPGREPRVSNATLGMVMLLGAETMFFAGLVGAFLMVRSGAHVWPPPLQPRLPVFVTGLNTLVLLGSGVTMALAVRAVRRQREAGLASALGITALLGALFLAVQGYEWARLVHYGLTVSSGSYGGSFYTLIGAHAVHVAAALAWLTVVFLLARRGRFGAGSRLAVMTCGMYWQFVVALWPILYVLVYLM